MSLFHRHQWRETSRQFNRSESYTMKGTGDFAYELARELEFGITVVELRCADCGDVKAVRYIGDCGLRANAQKDST